MTDFETLVAAVRKFAEERDWEQFHTPKNLAMAIAGEAGELVAELQWSDGARSTELVHEDAELRTRIAYEMADLLIYLARLADVTGIDAMQAAAEKLSINESRFLKPEVSEPPAQQG
ncbi:nucleotide pyrophosphohydrolase [Pseudactinotalea sp. Z1748]|uniref:nucleotide pyrophosphohydrolase n=1 Tax=Pseudactinotalea sp. Z1748 TaxID=3413027 RepID=UPI003C7D5571